MEALRQIDNPAYTAILFRRSFTSLKAANAIIPRSERWYPIYGGVYNRSDHVWRFPSGAHIYFAHLEYEHSKTIYQGAEFAFIGFDELTEFTETQYTYMFTRCRVAAGTGLRAYVRSTSNPGNIGHYWVKNRFITTDIVNKIRYFLDEDGASTPVPRGTPHALSRAFYPGKLSDNPSADPDYRSRILASGDEVLIAQLLDGDWDAENTAGRVYKNWSSIENITTDAEYDPTRPYWWAVDDGYAHGRGRGHESYHPRAILFMQHNAIGGVNVFDEYVATEEQAEVSIANALKLSDGRYGNPEIAYIDGSAAQLSGRIWNMGIMTANGTHEVVEGIKNLRRLICDGNGMRLYRVHPRCSEHIYEFGMYSSAVNHAAKQGEPPPLKVNDHTMDAARYGTYHLRHT